MARAVGLVRIEAIVLRTLNALPTLWEAGLAFGACSRHAST
jgi:hypothetical protein